MIKIAGYTSGELNDFKKLVEKTYLSKGNKIVQNNMEKLKSYG